MPFDPTTARPVGFDPSTAQELPARMNPNLAAQGGGIEANREIRTLEGFMNSRDPGIDYATGVPNASFRARFSRMRNDAEKASFLDNAVGKGDWGKDSFGAYYVTPTGAKKFGLQTDRPVSIDEQTASRYDVADVAGDAPAIIGATGYGMAASGLGAVPGLAMAGLGAGLGRAADEIVKRLQGSQRQDAGEVAKGIAGEMAGGAVGEGVARVMFPAARKILGPSAARMTPEKAALAQSAQDQGFKIRAGSVTDAPILARWEGMVRQIFGDLYEDTNRQAAQAGMSRLGPSQPVSKEAAGVGLANSIRRARVEFGEKAGGMYAKVDELVGNTPIVPTAPLKEQADAILASLPKTSDGKVVGGKDAVIRDILNMGERISVSQAQRLRTMLREASESPDLIPDVSMHDARQLKKAVDTAFDAAKQGPNFQSPAAIAALRAADDNYAQGIRRFDLPIINRITRDASRPGSLNADEVVDYLVKPDRVVRLRQVREVASPGDWAKVKDAHAQDLLSSVVKGTDDPLKSVFDGRGFRDSLDKYGRATLEEVHGKKWVDDAYAYAHALMLAEKRMKMSGGIVAANVALHPVKNLPKLLWLRGVAKVMEQPGTFNYLTNGIKVGPETANGSAQITRFLDQVLVNARDETGSAKTTFTSPEGTKADARLMRSDPQFMDRANELRQKLK